MPHTCKAVLDLGLVQVLVPHHLVKHSTQQIIQIYQKILQSHKNIDTIENKHSVDSILTDHRIINNQIKGMLRLTAAFIRKINKLVTFSELIV